MHDLIIRGGTVIDGTGAPARQADVAIAEGVVVAVGQGLGFAPVKPDRHDFLIQLMEGVEDIPGSVLTEGIKWQWESFPEHLDALGGQHFAIDVGTQVPHGAVRAYVMGDAGAKNEEAKPNTLDPECTTKNARSRTWRRTSHREVPGQDGQLEPCCE
jgi:N-acyl-D-aspartate/D-glutamate deacylase